MDYVVKKAAFKIKGFNKKSTTIINSQLKIYFKEDKLIYKIFNYLGKGSIGHVYLIQSDDSPEKYVIKIANKDCEEDILDEVKLVSKHFKLNNVVHDSFPLYYGEFINLKTVGIVSKFLGFYNLEKIKSLDYKLEFKHCIFIIKQLIEQLISFKNIIHADLKPSNVVVNVIDNNIVASIIDFGLIKGGKDKYDIISTNYITSPESLLSLDHNSSYVDANDTLYFYKHDYFGLFIIIINLFFKNNFWSVLINYLVYHLKIDEKLIQSQEGSVIFVYCWYRLFHKDKEELESKSYQNLIARIEKKYNNIVIKNFFDYNDFFRYVISPNINIELINSKNLVLLKDFIKKIIQFEPKNRAELTQLLEHPLISQIN